MKHKPRKRKRPEAVDQHDTETEGLPSSSGFDAEFRCPGKRTLCKRLPKDDDTVITLRGQRIHAAMEKGDFSSLSESDARTAQRLAYGESEIVHEHGFEGAEVTFEERVWDFDDNLEHEWSGRVDRYDWQPDKQRLLVIDDKSGWSIPPPIRENWQVRSEAALLSENLGAVETVAALIHPHHPDSLWEAHVYSRVEMLHLLDITRVNVQRIQQRNQRRIPGPIQCQWCQAKHICPEYKRDAEALDEAIADELLDHGFTAINRRTKDERAEHVRLIKQRIKDLDYILSQYVYLMERDPDSIHGYRLARKLTRHCVDEAKVMETVRKEYGDDMLDNCLSFSITEFEKQLSKKSNTAEAKSTIKRVLGPLLGYKKSENFLEEARSL